MARPVVGLIVGSGLKDPMLLEGGAQTPTATPYGSPSSALVVTHRTGVDVILLQRHGAGPRIPPHRINHRANLWALRELGTTAILATASTGSLKKVIHPGSFVVPHDFLSFWNIPTFHDEEGVHVTPGLDAKLRDLLVTASKKSGVSVRTRGVYVQTSGPRLETPAEIAHFATLGDVVGMTMASEATLANELGIPYAALCSVDNYCNGIVERPLTFDQIRATQARNAEGLLGTLKRALELVA
jgi:5'-methylthioadenosine phosphorylase